MLWSIKVSISEDRHLMLMVIYEKSIQFCAQKCASYM